MAEDGEEVKRTDGRKMPRKTITILFSLSLIAMGGVHQHTAAREAAGATPGRSPAVQEDSLEPADRNAVRAPLNTGGRTRLEVGGVFGSGAENPDVGVTLDGDTVEISGGGGIGLTLTIGHGLSARLDLDLTVGTQESRLIPTVEDAKGTFTRDFLLATLKYKVPLSPDVQLKFGGGVGSYRSGELDMELSALPAGVHTIVDYENVMGFHVTAEFEAWFGDSWFLVFGGKFTSVTYDAISYSQNGSVQPVGSFSSRRSLLSDPTGWTLPFWL